MYMYFDLQLPTIFETAVDKSSHSVCGRCPINTREWTLDRWLSWSETLTSEKHAGKWILLALIRKTLLNAKPNWLQRESCSALYTHSLQQDTASVGFTQPGPYTAHWRTDGRTEGPFLLVYYTRNPNNRYQPAPLAIPVNYSYTAKAYLQTTSEILMSNRNKLYIQRCQYLANYVKWRFFDLYTTTDADDM